MMMRHKPVGTAASCCYCASLWIPRDPVVPCYCWSGRSCCSCCNLYGTAAAAARDEAEN